jgi:transposase
VDTTSFSVSGQYTQTTATAREEQTEAESAIIAITYGYSRDHREDLKQWMLALATTHDGDIPLFLSPLDGNSSDKASLLMAITALQDQLREADGEPSVYVVDNGIYSEANMRQLNEAGVKWVSRVSETLTQAQMILHEGSSEWQCSEDGSVQWFRRMLELPQGTERWVIVRTVASLQRAQESLQRQVSRAQTSWTQKCWHLGNRRFACEADARAALERELKGKPTWIEVEVKFVAYPHHAGKGRPRTTGKLWQPRRSTGCVWTRKRCAKRVSLVAPMCSILPSSPIKH